MRRLFEALYLARSIKAAGPKRFAQHMVPHVVRPAQIIWNKVIALLFGVLAGGAFTSAFSYYSMKNDAGFALALFFGSVMLWFAVTSYLRVRRLSRL